MKSKFVELTEDYNEQIDELRKRCPHKKSWLRKRLDHSVVGAGCVYPSVHIVCTNCGAMKVIFRMHEGQNSDNQKEERDVPIKMTLKIQKGFTDQRNMCQADVWEVKRLIEQNSATL
jgi:hypothetical protein